MAELGFVDLRRMSHACIISARSPEEALRTARHIAAAAVWHRPGAESPAGAAAPAARPERAYTRTLSLSAA